jgi:hypothetical protein
MDDIFFRWMDARAHRRAVVRRCGGASAVLPTVRSGVGPRPCVCNRCVARITRERWWERSTSRTGPRLDGVLRVVTDRGHRPWSPTVVTDRGHRPWSPTVVTDRGHRPWSPTVVTDRGHRPWSPTVVTDRGHRPWSLDRGHSTMSSGRSLGKVIDDR